MISNEMCLLSDIFQNTKIESQKAVNDKISEQNTGPLSNTESTEKIPNKFLSCFVRLNYALMRIIYQRKKCLNQFQKMKKNLKCME